jgi:hypothetical protein
MGRRKPKTKRTRAGRGSDQLERASEASAGRDAGQLEHATETAPVVGAADRHIGEAMNDTSTPQLIAEADAAIAGAPADPTPQANGAAGAPAVGPSSADIEAGYAILAGAAIDMACEATCPAWEVTTDEKTKFSDAIAKAANLWFPDGIPERWVALIVVAGVGGQIVAARRDPVTGKLKPRYFPPKPEAEAPAATH